MRRFLFWCVLVLSAVCSTSVKALDCDTVPDCASLGYNMSVNECNGKVVLRCPRDPSNDNAVFCGGVCMGTKFVFNPLWDGQSASPKISSNWELMTAAKEAVTYVPDSIETNDEYFGRGRWYLPALGELMEVYGINYKKVNLGTGISGATGTNKTKINNALSKIGSSKAQTLSDEYHWTANEMSSTRSWMVNMEDGKRYVNDKDTEHKMRRFVMLTNAFETTVTPLAVGDIVYSDLSYTTAENYNASKTPVGVVAWVSESGASAKLISLKEVSSIWAPENTDVEEISNYIPQEVMNVSLNVGKGTVKSYEEVADCTSGAKVSPTSAATGGTGESTEASLVCVHGASLGRRCSCESGWTGTLCDTKECVYGTLSQDGETCTCETGWTGNSCNIRNCLHGTANGIVCNCETGWKGTLCDTVDCVNGTSVLGHCICSSGWTGEVCNTKNCAHGTVSADGQTCTCDPDWEGELCNQEIAMAAVTTGNDDCHFSLLWNGESETSTIISALGENGGTLYAAKAAREYYPSGLSSSNEYFGAGKWYLPALGELMEMYGVNYGAITAGDMGTGATGTNKTILNGALSTLANKGAAAETIQGVSHWSSSQADHWSSPQADGTYAWALDMAHGYRNKGSKDLTTQIRPFLLLENKFDGNIAIGDVVYKNLSYGKAADYNGSKTPVGMVVWVSDSGNSAKIMSLKRVANLPWGGKGTIITPMGESEDDLLTDFQSTATNLSNAYSCQEGN